MKTNLYPCIVMAVMATGISYCVSQSSGPQLQNRSEDALREIQAQVIESEYEINFQNDFGALMAANRAHNLRFRFHEAGFSASIRDPKGSAIQWGINLSLESYGRVGQPSRHPEITGWTRVASKKQLEATGPDLVIHYLNDRNGLKQDFTLKQRPPGHGLVSLTFQVQRMVFF